MQDFKERFAEYNASTGQYVFSNVRNGLIVGLVLSYSISTKAMATDVNLAIYRYHDWLLDCCPDCR